MHNFSGPTQLSALCKRIFAGMPRLGAYLSFCISRAGSLSRNAADKQPPQARSPQQDSPLPLTKPMWWTSPPLSLPRMAAHRGLSVDGRVCVIRCNARGDSSGLPTPTSPRSKQDATCSYTSARDLGRHFRPYPNSGLLLLPQLAHQFGKTLFSTLAHTCTG